MHRAPHVVVPPRGIVFGLGLALAIVLMHTVSSMLLTEIGYAYEETGGSPLVKIHPATFLMTLVLVTALLASGRPLAWVDQVLQSSRGALALLVMAFLIMGHAMLVVRLPFTNVIDTFLAPIIAYFLFKDLSEGRGHRLALIIHALMAANAIIALAEFATGDRLTPFWIAGQILDGDWRSTALLGHPLSNASITGCYLVTLALGGGRDLPQVLRWLTFLLNATAMIPFGGRAATVLMILILVAAGGLAVLRFLRGARVSRLSIAAVMVALPILVVPLLWAIDQGFFRLFIERFIDDQGSASTRLGMFDLLAEFSFRELLLAPDAQAVETMRIVHGLEFGIESFWISFILQFGIIPSIFFFAAMLWFLADVVRASGRGSALVLLYFMAVASTSVSLSGKGVQLAIVIAQILILLRLAPTMTNDVRTRFQAATGGRAPRRSMTQVPVEAA